MLGQPPEVLRTSAFLVRHKGRAVLRDIDMRLHAGEVGYVVGRNGSGKSSLARAIAGLELEVAGVCEVAGPAEGPRTAFVVAGMTLPPALSPRAVLQLGCLAMHGADLAPALDYASQSGLLPHLDQALGMLSLGTRQKVAIALALAAPARLLVLDEGTNGLDAPAVDATMRAVRQHLNRRQGAAVLVTHDLAQVAEHADLVWFLEDGRITRTCRVVAGGRAALAEALRLFLPAQAPAGQHEPDSRVLWWTSKKGKT